MGNLLCGEGELFKKIYSGQKITFIDDMVEERIKEIFEKLGIRYINDVYFLTKELVREQIKVSIEEFQKDNFTTTTIKVKVREKLYASFMVNISSPEYIYVGGVEYNYD